MLDHYIDNGYPLISQKFVLEQLAKPIGVLDKIEEVVIGRSQHQKQNFECLERYAEGLQDVKPQAVHRVNSYNNEEEILFDVIEFFDAIMDK